MRPSVFRPLCGAPVGLVAWMLAVGGSLVGGSAVWAQPDTGVQLNEGIPAQAEGVTVDQHLGTRLPMDEQVVDSSGHTVTLEHYFDGQRPVIVTLNYSDCPMLCSVQLNALSRTLNEMDLDLGNDFRVLTVSIDPNEKPERSRETQQLYVDQVPDQPRAGEAWHFATASESTIEKLTDALGFRYRFDKITKEYNHPAMLAFVSPEGVITSYSLRVDFPVEDMKRSLIAAGDGTIGSPVDRIIMWCLSYDPDRGRYVAVAWKLMRLGGALTVAVILLGLTPYWIGKRRKSLTGAEANEDQETSATDGGADE